MKTKEHIRYEDAAEPKTMTGWACKKCNRFYSQHDEHSARWCCSTDQPCACGGRKSKTYTCCDACRQKLNAERFTKLPRAEWDGDTPVAVWDGDQYFFSPVAVAEYCEKHELKLENVRLVLCEKDKSKRLFEMNEFMSDELAEDYTLDADEIDKAVNDWIEANVPALWHPTDTAVSLESLRLHVAPFMESVGEETVSGV